MKTIALAATSLATALLLVAGTAASAKDQANNRSYVVGKGGVARLADDVATQGETTCADQTTVADTQAQRMTIRTKSSPPVAQPIGVNEPGINRAMAAEGSGANVPASCGSAGMKTGSVMPQRGAMDAQAAGSSQGVNAAAGGTGGGASSAAYAATGRAPSPAGDAPSGSENGQVRTADPVQPD